MSTLTAEAVNRTFISCLNVRSDIADPDVIVVEGIVTTVAFSRAKIDIFREVIRDLLIQLPLPFFPTTMGGEGGWSFLQMCVDRDEWQWGEHPDMEHLCMLGIAAGIVKWCAPRSMWELLPGGMPYLVIDPAGELEPDEPPVV